eukprot:2154010-Rhodomonas_salina.3
MGSPTVGGPLASSRQHPGPDPGKPIQHRVCERRVRAARGRRARVGPGGAGGRGLVLGCACTVPAPMTKSSRARPLTCGVGRTRSHSRAQTHRAHSPARRNHACAGADHGRRSTLCADDSEVRQVRGGCFGVGFGARFGAVLGAERATSLVSMRPPITPSLSSTQQKYLIPQLSPT